MRRSKRLLQKRLTVVMYAVIAICFITVGYAVATQQLKVNGVSKVTGVWDIEFIDVLSTPIGSAMNYENPSYSGTSVTFKTKLNEPGDKMIYTITVKNSGNIKAIVESIEFDAGSNQDIIFTYQGIGVGNVLNGNSSHKFNVTVEYDKNVTSITKTSETVTFNVNYVQKDTSNIIETVKEPLPIIHAGREFNVVNTGNGLYADLYESGRYIFKGASPNNNIIFNNETWRILSIEADGTTKIVKDTSIGQMVWDEATNRNSTVDKFCGNSPYRGCSAWAKTDNVLDINGNIPSKFRQYSPNGNYMRDNAYFEGAVTTDATLNVYLNGEYYNSLNNDKNYIVSHKFNISTTGDEEDEETLELNIQEEKYYTWTGKIGLFTATEYMRTSSDNACTSLSASYNGEVNCGTNNWLNKGSNMWTQSPAIIVTCYGWYIKSNGNFGYDYNSAENKEVYPVVYLDSNIVLSGDGSTDNKYKIVKIRS